MFLKDLKQEAYAHQIEYIHVLPYAYDSYQSVVVALLPYYAGEFSSHLSRYTRGRDYHIVGREKMEQILRPLSSRYHFSYRIYVDASPLDERELALKAGLGVLGRNNLVLNEKYGSYCFIATALIDLPVQATPAPVQSCIGCGACMKNCPGTAISPEGVDYQKCLSRINQEKEISEAQAAFISQSGICWGCDACQTVCPYNRDIPISPIDAFTRELILRIGNLEELSNRAFRQKYANYSFSYKGKRILQRNIELLQNNTMNKKNCNAPS